MHYIETERLILRHFTDKDANALFTILSDEDVNKFLPMFPLKNIEETKTYIQNRYTAKYTQNKGFYYAICLKENDIPMGYVHISEDDSHDLGYGIKKEFWHQGICTEACRAVIDILKQTDTPYITATHDINNPRSGKVMQALGMKYQYSYEELWQPKNILVTFRMYQLNFDNHEDRIYKKYWDTYPIHFIEEI
ncbi:GNAT family N-acetyltransferase [Bacteroides fragilis]|uniref:GNAT family N-acetyltransferase n=1 Tax=Bacteroides fragilis TaxID=817 RepID=UPI00044C6D60|nr:GNAT family N-acetyltransferase [Bacteroides fragilis]EYA29763.1 acetyltransferase family protein [Bacteroides fragilis str. 1009-4-F \